MKTKTIATALSSLLIISLSLLIAGDPTDFEPQMEEWGKDMEKWGEKLEQSLESGQPIPPIPPIPPLSEDYNDQTPKLGVYLQDMDFEDAYQQHYPECYGVLITGVVKGGNADRAGLIKGDIIMEFGDDKVRFEDHLLNLRDSKKIGETVSVKYFRNEKVYDTELTFVPYEEEQEKYFNPEKVTTKKLSAGFGGGYVQALWLDYDAKGINTFIESYGFGEINDVTYIGGGGMGNIGNGWFLGGMGAGFTYDKNIPFTLPSGQNVKRSLKIESGFGGVTIMKKLPVFTNKIVLDMGTMIGGGGTSLEIAQSSGEYSWSDTGLEDGVNWYAKYEKGYFVANPSVGLLIRVKNWFGFHGSYGYLWTWAPDDDWTEKPFEFTVGGTSPDVPSGASATVGVWFGF